MALTPPRRWRGEGRLCDRPAQFHVTRYSSLWYDSRIAITQFSDCRCQVEPMLFKRIFWLTCAAVAIWLIWMRLRQQQDEFATTTPHFAPPRTFSPPTPAAPPARQPDLDEASAATPAPPPSAADTPPASVESADMAADVSEAGGIAEIEISGYCMRCKTKRPIQNAHREITESGRPAARGTCPICGANMFTFLATNDDT